MRIPACFEPADHIVGLLGMVKALGYARDARFVAFWWEECDNQLAWADSNLKVALGKGDNEYWLSKVRPALSRFGLGDADAKAQQVLVWDRQDDMLWIAPREDGIMFLCSETIMRQQGNGTGH